MCEISAVDFEATVDGEKLKKSYIAKYAPPGANVIKLFTSIICEFS
jgi:hypothetical protein